LQRHKPATVLHIHKKSGKWIDYSVYDDDDDAWEPYESHSVFDGLPSKVYKNLPYGAHISKKTGAFI
jgi:hypothetical protein